MRVSEARRGKDVFEYWIEDSTCRVYRVTFVWTGRFVQIDFEFQSPHGMIPNRVTTVRYSIRNGDRGESQPVETVHRRVYTVTKFETGVPFPDDRFSIASCDMAVNTAINDYRINRITGSRDGTSNAPRPRTNPRDMDCGESAPPALGAQPQAHNGLIVLDLVLLGALAVVFWWRGIFRKSNRRES